MPLVDYSLELVNRVLTAADTDPQRTGLVACLAYPDVVASVGTVTRIFGDRVRGIAARQDSAAIVGWHKAWSITDTILDTSALFRALGYDTVAYDVSVGRGGERFQDLSLRLANDPERLADLVFDCISNQVFNVAEAWWTMVRLCRVGGHVLSVTPVNMINQGFWNVSPTAYEDFAAANGLQVVERRSVVGVYTEKGQVALEPVRRARGVPDDTMNVVLLRKTEARRQPVWPIMTKFQIHPTCLKLEA